MFDLIFGYKDPIKNKQDTASFCTVYEFVRQMEEGKSSVPITGKDVDAMFFGGRHSMHFETVTGLLKYCKTMSESKKESVFHKYITVNSNEQREEHFVGDLADFAAKKLSEWRLSEEPTARIISIKGQQTTEIRVREELRETMQLSVWLERQ